MKKALPFWSELPDQERRLLLAHAVVAAYPRGGVVFNPLKKETGVRAVLNGQVRLSIQTEQGGELFLHQLNPGELCLFSLFSLMQTYGWDVHMETVKRSEIVTIPEQVYMRASGRNPQMEAFNNRIMFEWMAEAVRIVSEYALADTEQRLADLLLRYHRIQGSNCLATTHERMARDIGSAREVVSRQLKQFANDGLVELGRGKVKILDLDTIKSIKLSK